MSDAPKKIDIRSLASSELSWLPEDRAKSLRAMFDHVVCTAEQAIDWYFAAKRGKQRGAVCIRFSSIAIGTLAGLVPIVASIWTTEQGSPMIPPAIASACLLVAAALVLLDRFFGYSDGWIRYVTTATTIRIALADFRLQWEVERTQWNLGKPSDEQTLASIAACRQALAKINGFVDQETREWAAAFRDAIRESEKAMEASRERVEQAAKATAPGALNIVVPNGNDFAAGWSLSIDAGPARCCRGKTATESVVPGLHTVRAAGKIGDKDRTAATSVDVPAGQAVSVTLDLA